MLGSVAAINAVSITIPNDPDILCLLGFTLTATSVGAPTLAAAAQRYRPRKFSDIAILRKGIEWISSVDKTGAADGEKSFYFTDRFGHHAVWLAGLKLALELNKGVIGGIESVCQRCSNI